MISVAHCFGLNNITRIYAYSPTYSIDSEADNEQTQTHEVERVCVSHKYQDENPADGTLTNIRVYDVAIMLLRIPINFNGIVQPASLPSAIMLIQGVVVGMGPQRTLWCLQHYNIHLPEFHVTV